MQWIHKVKIHPKMIYNRPPLNCQKCQFRFFTDQGLERHLLGTHGLVTSSMQDQANRGKDGGRCPVCGRVSLTDFFSDRFPQKTYCARTKNLRRKNCQSLGSKVNRFLSLFISRMAKLLNAIAQMKGRRKKTIVKCFPWR